MEAFIRGAQTFQCYATDRYEEYLESKREEIVSRFLEVCKTKRRNLFKTGPVAEGVANHFSIHRLYDKKNTNSIVNRFVSEVIEQLVAEGRLVTAHAHQGEGVRTATAQELGEQRYNPTEQTEGQMFMTM